jgi:uncharacterized protein DUF1877
MRPAGTRKGRALRWPAGLRERSTLRRNTVSVIAYYVHLDAEQMQELRAAPAKLWRMRGDAKFAGAELFDMDKDWQVIPWLLSEKKREEQQWQAAQMAALMRKDIAPQDSKGFEKALAEERKKLGVTSDPDTTNRMLNDPVLTAVEGRGTKDQRDEAINFGMGGARVFPPPEVKSLAGQLSKIEPAELRRHFDRKQMARWDVGGLGWLEEDDSVLDQALIPTFKRFQAFYNRAAEAGHYVLVVYQ